MSPVPVEYRDRSLGLILFGAFTVVIGCLALLIVPLAIFGAAAVAKAAGTAPQYGQAVFAAIVYAGIGGGLISLGYGSIRKRRWARSLLVIFSWTWLLTGIFAVGLLMAFLPDLAEGISRSIAAQGGPKPLPVMIHTALFSMLVFSTSFLVVIPAIWVFFYGSKNVRITCEVEDDQERWTDRCPPTVLAVSLWLGISVPMMVMMAFAYHGVFPFFGLMLSGLPGGLMYLMVAAVWGYAAWATYHLRMIGWWVTTVSFCLLMASAWMTFLQHDLIEMYRLMGMPPQQLQQIEILGPALRPMMLWSSGLFQAPLLLSLIWIRKYFNRPPEI